MKYLIAAFTVAAITAAQAQVLTDPPQIVPINNAQGNRIGTATISGNRVVLRWSDGTLIGTVVEEKGTRTFYDPSGKITDQPAWDRTVAGLLERRWPAIQLPPIPPLSPEGEDGRAAAR
jgi:hypothetical protein